MTLDHPKRGDTFRSAIYLDYVRSQPCIICEKLGWKQVGRTQPHHVEGVGKAIEGSDARTVPVDQRHHPQSPKQFKIMCRELGLDVDALVAEVQARFCAEQGYDLRPFMDRDRDPFEELLVKAGLGSYMDTAKRVSKGTAKSKSTKLSKRRPLSRISNSFRDGKFTETK